MFRISRASVAFRFRCCAAAEFGLGWRAHRRFVYDGIWMTLDIRARRARARAHAHTQTRQLVCALISRSMKALGGALVSRAICWSSVFVFIHEYVHI